MNQRPENVAHDDWGKLQNGLESVTTKGMDVKALQTADPAHLGNDPKMEMVWAEKAGKHAETYLKLLKIFPDKTKFKLTKIDDELYQDFRNHFPSMNVRKIDEIKLTNQSGKSKWRKLLGKYDRTNKVSDYSMGTLLRIDSRKGIDEDNIIVVTRIQFHFIEIARNREGHNDHI